MFPFVISGQLHLGEIYPNRSRLDYCWHLSPRNSGALLLTDVLCYKSKTRLGSVEQTNESTKLLHVLILSQAPAWLTEEALNDMTASPPAESNRNHLISGLKLHQQPKKYKLRFQGKCCNGMMV